MTKPKENIRSETRGVKELCLRIACDAFNFERRETVQEPIPVSLYTSNKSIVSEL